MTSRTINKVTLIGNILYPPEREILDNGALVLHFEIVTNYLHKNRIGEVKESRTRHKCIVWDRFAEVCERLLATGDYVYVDGRINNTENGNEVVVNELIMLQKKGANYEQDGQYSEPNQQ